MTSHKRLKASPEAARTEEAQAVLNLPERITLSARDFARFVELIENPLPPTPELREALAEYQRLKAAHPECNL